MVEWSARRCAFCRRPITFADRWHWAGGISPPALTMGALLMGSLLGLIFFQCPPGVLAMSLSVPLGFWSVFRSTPLQPEAARDYYP
jgi:hypothetical protein